MRARRSSGCQTHEQDAAAAKHRLPPTAWHRFAEFPRLEQKQKHDLFSPSSSFRNGVQGEMGKGQGGAQREGGRKPGGGVVLRVNAALEAVSTAESITDLVWLGCVGSAEEGRVAQDGRRQLSRVVGPQRRPRAQGAELRASVEAENFVRAGLGQPAADEQAWGGRWSAVPDVQRFCGAQDAACREQDCVEHLLKCMSR